MIHHNDCTWCLERYSAFVKEGRTTREKELCHKGHMVVAPLKGLRYCEEYRQIGCPECEAGSLATEHTC